MLKLFLKVIGAILFIFLSACNQYYSDQHIEVKEDGLIYKVGQSEPYTGRILDTLNNNVLEYDVVNGLKNGEFRISSIDGIVSMYGNLQDNRNIGIWHYYYPNGNLESNGNFKDDKPHGKWTWYFPNGNIKETGTFFEGIKTGKWYEYNSEGIVTAISLYDAGDKINEVNYKIFRGV
jgi:antitoxin component YwqK of YwqJK toxin-antitoxin module